MGYPPQGVAIRTVLTIMQATLAAAQAGQIAAQSALVALQVDSPNGDGNETINQLLGNRNDDLNAATLFSRSRDIWEDTHYEQEVWPTLADAIIVTAHADAWTLGNYAEIVATNAISAEFHIHHIHISAPSANGEYELVLYAGTTEIMKVSFSRTDKKDDIEGLEVRAPHCAANTQIQAKLASSNPASADTLKVKIWYHLHG